MKFFTSPFTFFLLCWLASLFGASAQAAVVTASVQPATARPNQVVNYVITVENGQVQGLPNLRFPLQIGQTSGVTTSQEIQIINGRQSLKTQLAWGITATEPGEFVIPPQTLTVDNQSFTTNEVVFVVQNGGGNSPTGRTTGASAEDDPNQPILQIELGKKEIYQGEVVPIAVSLYLPRQVQLRRIGLIEMEKSDFAIARFPQTNEQSSTIIDGVGYYVLTFRSTLSSLRTGSLKVGPANLELLVEMPLDPRQGNGMVPPGFPQNFPPGFFPNFSEPRKLEVKSQQVTMNVLPLPADGKPANFSGAVGEFQIEATASPLQLTVGDPISVELMVAGAGNFDALNTPAPVEPSGWKLYPAKRYLIEGQLDQNQTPTLERKIGFTQVMVPEAVHKEVPPFELNFFSPSQKKYVSLRTQPIALTMTPAPAADPASQAASGAGATVPGDEIPLPPPPVVQPQPDITDILIQPSPQAYWLSGTSRPLWRSPTFWGLQAVPIVLFILASIAAYLRRVRLERADGPSGAIRSAWAEFETKGARSSDEDFLRSAVQFIQTAQSAKVSTADPALASVFQDYQTHNFSAQPAPALPAQRRKEIQKTLFALFRSTLVKVGLFFIFFASHALLPLQAEEAPKAKAATPDDVYRDAVAELAKGQYNKAQYLAESLTKKDPPHLSPDAFQIIGHSRYRQKDLGRAALWYQRALLLSPRDAELRQNLHHLHDQTKFFTFKKDSPLKEASLWLSMNEWLTVAAVCLWLCFMPLILRKLMPSPHGGNWTKVIMVGACLGFIVSALFAAIRPLGADQVRNILVITSDNVDAFTAATVTSGTVISLPPGSHIKELERRSSWVYAEIPSTDHNLPLRGWVELAATTPFWPWSSDLVP